MKNSRPLNKIHDLFKKKNNKLLGSYFPLPNNIYLNNKTKSVIESSLTLTNFPGNILSKNLKKVDYKKLIYFDIYFLNKNVWTKYMQIKCDFGETIEISRTKINLDPNLSIVIVPSKDGKNPTNARYLPSPSSSRFDNSPVQERASYNFKIGSSESSFQGEYPYSMTNNKKGSFLSFDSLRLDNNKNIISFLIPLNLNRDAENNIIHEINFSSSDNFNLINKIFLKTNETNAILLSKINEPKNKPIFIHSNSLLLVPLFINVHERNEVYQISIEHTHPPSEMFWGSDKFKIVKDLKEKWITK